MKDRRTVQRKTTVKTLRIWVALLAAISILSSTPILVAQPSGQYTGRKISLDFRDADIRNVLGFIADVAELNIVVGNDVKGRVTIRLVDVPWDQALEVILQSESLGVKRTGNVLWIAPEDRLRKEEEARLASKRTTEKLVDLETEMIRLKYADAREMASIVKNFLSDRGRVTVDVRTNTLIVRDVPKNIEEIKDLFR
jgi:type IV pilus assembly protein PilQ